MKYLFLLLSILFLFSCKKNDDTPPKVSIIGSWTNSIATDKKPTFSDNMIEWSDLTYDSISIVQNTIYLVYPSAPKQAAWTFKISSNNDTLTLIPFNLSLNDISIYWRVK